VAIDQTLIVWVDRRQMISASSPRVLMSKVQQDACLTVLDKLSTYSICSLFTESPEIAASDSDTPVFPVRRLGLNDVRQKLLNNEYPTVAAWREDVERIWAISLVQSARGSTIADIAGELQNHFRKLTQHLSDSPETDWFNKLCVLRDELNSMSRKTAIIKEQPPKPIIPKPIIPKPIIPKPPPKPVLPKPVPQPKPVPPKPQKPAKPLLPFSKTDILRLSEDVRAIRDPIQILTVFAIMEKEQSSGKIGLERLEMDCAGLKLGTLHALREKLDQFLAQ
jgi:hypothetical protein